MTPTHAPIHDSAHIERALSKSIFPFRPSRAPMCKPTAGPPPARQIARFGPVAAGAPCAIPLTASMAAVAAPGSFAAHSLKASIAAATFASSGVSAALLPLVSELMAPTLHLAVRISVLKLNIYFAVFASTVAVPRRSSCDCSQRLAQPAWYPAKRRGQPTHLTTSSRAATRNVRRSPSPRHHADGLACRSWVGFKLTIDDVVDERHVIHHCEMGTLADMDLQT